MSCACHTTGYGMRSRCLVHARRVRGNTVDALRLGLTAAYLLAAHNGLTVARLAQLMGVSKGTAERLVERLLEAGIDVLVTRDPDPSHPQRHILSINNARVENGRLVLDLGEDFHAAFSMRAAGQTGLAKRGRGTWK